MAGLVWQDGETVVMTGDSITDCGRRGDAAPFGAGYVRQVIAQVTARYPDRAIKFVNTGIGGNCVDDLQGRWREDVLDHQPDWVTIMIGINDLHRTLNAVKDLGPAEYERRYRDVLDQTRSAGAKLVLIDPFYMSLEHGQETHQGEVLKRLDGYLAVVDKLAGEYGALHVKTQDAWLKVLPHHPQAEWCNEPVHPNVDGHLVIAHAVLSTLGY